MTREQATEKEKEEFLEEIEFMKQLEYHPHLLSLVACSTDPKCPLIVTGICELGDLLSLVRKINPSQEGVVMDDSLDFNDLVPVAWQISDALTFLSSKMIVHRDVAARNILVTKKKMAKLSDFGLCRSIKETDFFKSYGEKLPIKWMAPESIESACFSTKSDVWSFGILLFEMYSFGETPYMSMDPTDVLSFLEDGNRLELSESTPKLISSLIESCWLEEPTERPDFSHLQKQFYQEMESNSEKYGYLQFSKNYYRQEPVSDLDSSKPQMDFHF
ncbi:unnamed protein product, partial [Mesorhabditis belari]|uniref:Protein kinase domain-containing protein n=1 Tax=Mesorhabditis belari TaxID=2138241 RepID=A0AAF3ESA1_9BILA